MEKNILSKNLRGIILVYGIPGSGKSYFSKQLIKNLTINANLNLFYLEIDVLEIFSSKFQLDDQFLNKFEIKMEEFQSSMHNCLNKIFHISKKIEKDDVTISGGKDFKEFEFNGKEVESYFFNNKTWKTARDLALKITEKLISYYSELQKNFIIVVDDNFILKSMRKKYYQLCNKYKYYY